MRISLRPLAGTILATAALTLAGCTTGGRGENPEKNVQEKEREDRDRSQAELPYKNPGKPAPEAPIIPSPEPHLPETTKYVPEKENNKADDPNKGTPKSSQTPAPKDQMPPNN